MNEHKKVFSKIGFNYLLLALIPLILQILIINIIALWDGTLIKNINVQTIISSITNYIIILPIFILLMKRIESSEISKERLGIKKFITYICIAMTLMWIGNIIGMIITTIIGNTVANDVVNPIEKLIQNSSIYINLLVISILAPIFEEIFFRKLLIDRTIKYGAKLSILLSALLFALFHGNLSQFFYAFMLGGFFAYIYIKTGNIIYSIICHAIVNLYGSVISTFFNLSLHNLQNGISMANIGDIGMVAFYIISLIIIWSIGLYTIFKNYKNIEFEDENRKKKQKKPLRTVFLNPGMMLFIAYHIVIILISLNIL